MPKYVLWGLKFLYYLLKIYRSYNFEFFIFVLEDLEAAERITISRKFKDDVVRPILKVKMVQVNVKRCEGFL